MLLIKDGGAVKIFPRHGEELAARRELGGGHFVVERPLGQFYRVVEHDDVGECFEGFSSSETRMYF